MKNLTETILGTTNPSESAASPASGSSPATSNLQPTYNQSSPELSPFDTAVQAAEQREKDRQSAKELQEKIDNSRQDPILRFTPYAWAKLLFLRDIGSTEIGCFGLADESDPLLIVDLAVPKQYCSAAFVEFDDESVADMIDEQIDNGRMPNHCSRVWIHTHPGSSAKPSSVDERTFYNAFGGNNWAIMFILARGGETYCRMRVRADQDMYLNAELDHIVTYLDVQFPGTDQNAWLQEYKDNVQPERESVSFVSHSKLGEEVVVWNYAKKDFTRATASDLYPSQSFRPAVGFSNDAPAFNGSGFLPSSSSPAATSQPSSSPQPSSASQPSAASRFIPVPAKRPKGKKAKQRAMDLMQTLVENMDGDLAAALLRSNAGGKFLSLLPHELSTYLDERDLDDASAVSLMRQLNADMANDGFPPTTMFSDMAKRERDELLASEIEFDQELDPVDLDEYGSYLSETSCNAIVGGASQLGFSDSPQSPSVTGFTDL